MAFVVHRPSGNWELRESRTTPAGPRARTLASFRSLDDGVLEHAAARAHHVFDRAAVRRAAWRAGAPVAREGIDEDVARLLHRLQRGDRASPTLVRLLIHALGGDAELSEAELGAAEWIGASVRERGETLVDLLGLADALPSEREDELRFPPLRPVTE